MFCRHENVSDQMWHCVQCSIAIDLALQQVNAPTTVAEFSFSFRQQQGTDGTTMPPIHLDIVLAKQQSLHHN